MKGTHTVNQALWHVDANHSELRPVADTGSTEKLAKVSAHYSLVSTGTEKLVSSGSVGSELESAMTVPYMQGSFSLPIQYGYAMIGRTDEGQYVHVMHPHQRTAFVDKQDLFFLPEGANLKRMALISNMETVINALWDMELFFTKQDLTSLPIAIVGFGNIGSMLALTLAKQYQVSPYIIETDPWRLQQAVELGFNACMPSDCTQEFALTFNTSHNQAGLQWCLDSSCMEGVVIDLSWYGSKALQLKLGTTFHYRRLRLISSQVSTIPGHKIQESYASRKRLAAQLLMDPVYDRIISHCIAFEDAPAFFDRLRKQSLEPGLIWLFEY